MNKLHFKKGLSWSALTRLCSPRPHQLCSRMRRAKSTQAMMLDSPPASLPTTLFEKIPLELAKKTYGNGSRLVEEREAQTVDAS